MDEFKDLDVELARLRQELSAKDEMVRQLHFPADDYWKRRVDEEKILWKKKLDLRDEERKALETKLSTQQSQIEQYHQNFKDLEKKFEYEARQWEERLRVKEADLLIEKNRLLSEEKVREAESKNKELLGQLVELNARLSRLKDEQVAEKEKLGERFALERGAYEEKMQAHLQHVEVLKSRVQELETDLKERMAEWEKIKQEQLRKLEQAGQQAAQLGREKESLSEAVVHLEKAVEEEKGRLQKSFLESNGGFVQNMRRHVGPITGLIQFVSANRASPSSWAVFKELVQKIENETELFMVQAGIPSSLGESCRVALCVPDIDVPYWQSALSAMKADIKIMSPKTVAREISAVKPRVLIMSGGFAKAGRRIRSAVPFLPVIMSGDMKPGRSTRLLAQGFKVLPYPATNEEVTTTVAVEAQNSIALPEYWNKITAKRNYLAPALAAAALVLALYTGSQMRTLPFPALFSGSSSVATPYSQPTNITYDGKFLWTCDWLGQSIYQHRAGGDLKLMRIFCLPGRHFSALAWAGGNLWSVDPWENKIYKHNTDENLSVIASFPVPGTSPSGIAGNEKYLWSCDASRGEIYRHRFGEGLPVEAVYKSPGTSPSGLYFDGEDLWSVDSRTNKAYRHRLDATLSVAAAYLLPNYGQKGFNVSGIARDKTTFWICSEKAGRIYRYPKSALREVKS
ncbi:MAG: NHL repeat-containing protein [Endomicrobiales bacterium]